MKAIYIILIVLCAIPLTLMGLPFEISPAIALALGLVFAIVAPANPCPKFNKKASKLLLQAAVVGLGFGMNAIESLKSGAEGMSFTIVSVAAVMAVGFILGAGLRVDRNTSWLISSGTAICGGSAIAAVAPVVRANSSQMAVALGVVFILNSIALFIFPPIGHLLDMSQQQFGTWAAIAIHDTSSVVGAGEAYGPEALQVATLVKLTRALWIIPLAFVSMAIFRQKGTKVSIPWFIFLFVLAMCVNTWLPLPAALTDTIVLASRRAMVVTLFLIGASLSPSAIRQVGSRPLVLAILLWALIGFSSLAVVLLTIQ
ncbi:MAG: putative sulfate exporter family transporter [Muribaculaceae bacterium]|nr:putative sulfate exporter family transporter [Muribaculaceae bacterium]